ATSSVFRNPGAAIYSRRDEKNGPTTAWAARPARPARGPRAAGPPSPERFLRAGPSTLPETGRSFQQQIHSRERLSARRAHSPSAYFRPGPAKFAPGKKKSGINGGGAHLFSVRRPPGSVTINPHEGTRHP